MTKCAAYWTGIILLTLLILSCAKHDTSDSAALSPTSPPPAPKPTPTPGFPNVSNSIFGRWQSDLAFTGPNAGLYSFELAFNQQGDSELLAHCEHNGQTDELAIDQPAQIATNTVAFAGAQTTVDSTNSDCALAIGPGPYSYQVQGDHLHISLSSTLGGDYSRVSQ